MQDERDKRIKELEEENKRLRDQKKELQKTVQRLAPRSSMDAKLNKIYEGRLVTS
jgi:hypothetical protein